MGLHKLLQSIFVNFPFDFQLSDLAKLRDVRHIQANDHKVEFLFRVIRHLRILNKPEIAEAKRMEAVISLKAYGGKECWGKGVWKSFLGNLVSFLEKLNGSD